MHKILRQLGKRTGSIVVILLLGVGSAFAFNFPGFNTKNTVKAFNGTITIPEGEVADGKAHFYRFADDGKEIAFFVVKGTDGLFHVAFDACDVCFEEKKGYVQDGANMICRNCNKKFATNRIGNENTGGCNPSHLAFTRANGKIVIKVDDLKPGARFF